MIRKKTVYLSMTAVLLLSLMFVFTRIENEGNDLKQKLTVPIAEVPQDALILDVRLPFEIKQAALKRPFVAVPLDKLDVDKFAKENMTDGNKTVYILCRSGRRAEVAAQKFIFAGVKNVKVIEGGILEAQKQGEPVVKSTDK